MPNNQNYIPATLPMITPDLKQELEEMSNRIDRYSDQLGPLPPPTFLVFYTTKDRYPGYKSEVRNAQKLGEAIRARPELEQDPSAEKLLRIVGNATVQSTCLIVAIMCHGSSGTIELADGSILEVSEVIDAMDTRFMSGKPKVS